MRQIPSCRLRNIAGYVTETKGGRWRVAARQRYLSFPEWPHQWITFFQRAANKKPTKAKPIGSHAVGIHINHIIQLLLKYQTDLTDKQKLIVRASLPQNMTLPRKYDLFDILDAIFYITETGCKWSMLPNDCPLRTASFLERDRRQQTHQGNKGTPRHR